MKVHKAVNGPWMDRKLMTGVATPACEKQAIYPASKFWENVTCKRCLKKRAAIRARDG